VLRGIYPVVAVIDEDGWARVDDEELAAVYAAIMDEAREAHS
jgi:proteasome beta subunit